MQYKALCNLVMKSAIQLKFINIVIIILSRRRYPCLLKQETCHTCTFLLTFTHIFEFSTVPLCFGSFFYP